MRPHIIRRDSCPICAFASPRVIFSRAYTDLELQSYLQSAFGAGIYRERHLLEKAAYTIHFCDRCRLAFQRDVPDESLLDRLQALRRLIVSANSSCHQITQADDAKRSTAIFLTAALAHLDVTSLRTLRFGFDSWEYPQTSTPSCARMDRATDSPRAREFPELPGKQPMATNEPANDNFDVIHVCHALESSSDPRSLVMCLARKLRARGVLHLAVRNGTRIHGTLRRFERDLAESQCRNRQALVPLLDLNCFCPATLLHLASECGLARLRPGWRSVLQAYRAHDDDSKRLLRTLTHVLHLRSRLSTDLLFRKPDAADGVRRSNVVT